MCTKLAIFCVLVAAVAYQLSATPFDTLVGGKGCDSSWRSALLPIDAADPCASTETCCSYTGDLSWYACCPKANATCCPDRQHCCASEATCLTGTSGFFCASFTSVGCTG